MPQVTIGLPSGESFDEEQLDIIIAALKEIQTNELQNIKRHCEDPENLNLSRRAVDALTIKGLLQNGSLTPKTQAIILKCIVVTEKGTWVREPSKKPVLT